VGAQVRFPLTQEPLAAHFDGMTAVRPAAQTVLFQMAIETMIDRLPPLHDRGVTPRVP
jgi:hypothetical protein